MRLKALLGLVAGASALSGCGSMRFMNSPGMLLAEQRAACREMRDYAQRQRCLARCWEQQKLIWASQLEEDRALRTPSSLADDPGLAHAIFGG